MRKERVEEQKEEEKELKRDEDEKMDPRTSLAFMAVQYRKGYEPPSLLLFLHRGNCRCHSKMASQPLFHAFSLLS